jgi:hypothetical protein
MFIRVAHTAATAAVSVRHGGCSAGGVWVGGWPNPSGVCGGGEGGHMAWVDRGCGSVSITVCLRRPFRADLVLHAFL